ncbi:hypothetical protein QCA50_011152 [Cerrena zonata]|uniref:F-box domain-containing protein n=1 Tax=Cerrena zonata TaxID=2478898 RepID=A0AAW0FY00_9APHY
MDLARGIWGMLRYRMARKTRIKNAKKAAQALDVDRSKNAQQPINRLPVEILCEILLLCHSPFNTEWMNITKVCHHWREIAFDLPQLWNKINLCNFDIGKLSLAHAKEVNLHLDYRKGSSISMPLLKDCLHMLERVSSIHLDGLFLTYPNTLSSIPPCSLPLRSLFVSECPTFAIQLEECTFPDIRELHIVCMRDFCDVPFCLLGSTLRRLTLGGAILDYSPLLNYLANMPHLEHLELIYLELAHFDDLSAHDRTVSRIDLPRLQTLVLKSHVWQSPSAGLHLDLLSKLYPPPSTTVNIVFTDKNNVSEDAMMFFPLFTFLRRLNRQAMHLQLPPTRTGSFSITFWPFRINPSENNLDPTGCDYLASPFSETSLDLGILQKIACG